MTFLCDWVSFQNAEKKRHIITVGCGYRCDGHARSSMLSDAVRESWVFLRPQVMSVSEDRSYGS